MSRKIKGAEELTDEKIESMSWDEIYNLYPAKGDGGLGRLKHQDEIDIDTEDYQTKKYYNLDTPDSYYKRNPASLGKTKNAIDWAIEKKEVIDESFFRRQNQTFAQRRQTATQRTLATFTRWASCS